MALYLGEKKVTPVLHKEQRCANGKVMSDAKGVITFPKLDFTPKIITIWNVRKHDWTTDEDFEEGWVPYTYDGIMLVAVKHDDMWLAQIPHANSGAVGISNGSYVKAAITVDNGIYSYNLALRSSTGDYDHNTYGDAFNIANMEFNYAIYG